MAKKSPKNTVGRKPSKANLRKQSTPKTEEEERQAIRDDIKGDVIGYLRSVLMEQTVNARTMKRVMGTGGEKLETFIEQLERGGSDMHSKVERTEKEVAPAAKRISRDAVIKSALDDELKSDSKTTKYSPTPKTK